MCHYFLNMKTAIPLLLFYFLSTLSVAAQDMLHFDEQGYAAALQRSKMEKKPIFYMVYATWCPHCNKMKEQVFTDPKVVDFFSKHFVCAWQDIEQGEGQALKKKFGVHFFPYFAFLDENGTILYAINGEFKADDLIAEAHNALDPLKQLPYLENAFYADTSNAEKCLAYLTTLKKGKERTYLNPAAHAYFETQKEGQLLSDINWRIFANGVSDIQSREFRYVAAHQAEFAKIASPARVEKKMMNAVSELLVPFTDNLDTIGYKTQRAIAKTVGLQKTDSLIFRYDLSIMERSYNWKGYKKASMGEVEKFAWNNAALIKEIAAVYVQYYADEESLKYALKLVQRAITLTPAYDAYLLQAKIYRKMNNKADAKTAAEKAKEIATSFGWDTKDADALLKEYSTK